MDEAVHRRLDQELRMRSDLHFLYKFQYHARFGELGSENELCWVYAGISDDPVSPNGNEVADWRWISAAALDRELESSPELYTPWLVLEWPEVARRYREVLGFNAHGDG
jgi:isopentenyl-diphosphate delta-isomerase